MTTDQRHRWDTLGEALVGLHRLDGVDLRERIWAQRVLGIAASLHEPSRVDAWVAVRHQRVWTAYTTDASGGGVCTREIGRQALPSIEAWLGRSAGEGRELGSSGPWSAECRRLGLSHPARVWALAGETGPLGLLSARLRQAGPGGDERFAMLARHAGRALENYRLVQELHRDAQTDGLTNAYNYRYFMSCLQREMKRLSRNEGSLAVLMVDVDNLKEYNDRFGHLGGSAALKELATLLRRNTRAIDIVAKYGGDEFCVLLPGCDSDGAAQCARRVLSRIEEHQFEDDPGRRLTISTGIAVHPVDGARDARELLRRADERLFEAKRAGRNRVYGPSH